MTMTQTIYSNVVIYNGIDTEPFKANVCCQDGLIGKITPNIKEIKTNKNTKIIKGGNLILSPGFIDVHTHSDATNLENFTPIGKFAQGITTEIMGNCGLSPFPVTEHNFENLTKVYQKYPVLSELLKNSNENFSYTNYKINKFSIPSFSLVGYNSLRAAVSGYKQKELSSRQINLMIKLLRRELKAGAIGLSAGFLYSPGIFSSKEEIIKVLEGVNDYNIIFCCHLRSEGDSICKSITEMIKICKEAKIQKLHLSHLKIAKKQNWHKIDKVFELINNCKTPKITFDRYPYTESLSSLSLTLPQKFSSMPDAEIHTYLQNEINFHNTLEEVKKYQHNYFDKIILVSTPSKKYSNFSGFTINEIADQSQKTISPAEILLNILKSDCVSTLGAFCNGMNPKNMHKIITDSRCCCGTDEINRPLNYTFGRSHPRGFNSFPKFASILHQNNYQIGEIIRRFTFQSVKLFNLEKYKIGAIKEGYKANLILINFDEYINNNDNATFKEPHKLANGVKGCWINGTQVF